MSKGLLHVVSSLSLSLPCLFRNTSLFLHLLTVSHFISPHPLLSTVLIGVTTPCPSLPAPLPPTSPSHLSLPAPLPPTFHSLPPLPPTPHSPLRYFLQRPVSSLLYYFLAKSSWPNFYCIVANCVCMVCMHRTCMKTCSMQTLLMCLIFV